MNFSEVPSSLKEGFSLYDTFILVGHEQPDADCLCSQIGLAASAQKDEQRSPYAGSQTLRPPGNPQPRTSVRIGLAGTAI